MVRKLYIFLNKSFKHYVIFSFKFLDLKDTICIIYPEVISSSSKVKDLLRCLNLKSLGTALKLYKLA